MLRPEAGALELLRRNPVDAPRVYQSLEKGTLPLLCTGILPLSRALVAKLHSAALRCPEPGSRNSTRASSPCLNLSMRRCAEASISTTQVELSCPQGTKQPLVPRPALSAAVAQAAI